MFAAFLCTILFSISSICGHRSAKLIGGTEANFWRLLLAAVLLGTWSFTFGVGLGGPAFGIFFLSGLIGIGLGDVALFQAFPRLGAPLTSLLIQSFTTPLGVLIEWAWLGTTLSAAQAGCVLLILVGVGVTLAPGEHVRASGRALWAGVGFSLVAALGTALGAVLSRKAYAIAESLSEPVPGPNAAFQRIVGGLLVAALFVLVVRRSAFRLQADASPGVVVEVARKKWGQVWLFVLINGLAGQTLGMSSMQWALETTPTGVVLAILSLTPIMIIPLAWIFEGEKPTRRSLVGAGVAVAGAVGLSLLRLRG